MRSLALEIPCNYFSALLDMCDGMLYDYAVLCIRHKQHGRA